MIASAIFALFGRAVPTWLTKPVGYLIDALVVAALLIGAYLLIYGRGETAGAVKVTTKTEQDHAKAVTDARHDEGAAQSVAEQIGATTAHSNDLATQFAQSKIEDMHNAIIAVPAPAPGAPLPAAPVDSMRDSLNAIGDRAERAAEAADALP